MLIGGGLLDEVGNEAVAFVLDLTARKRAEEALRESEAKFRDYAETASDWFWEIGPDYKFTLLTENALVRIRQSESARRAGITLSILKRNPRSGGSFGKLSMHVNCSATSSIAPWAATVCQST